MVWCYAIGVVEASIQLAGVGLIRFVASLLLFQNLVGDVQGLGTNSVKTWMLVWKAGGFFLGSS